MPSGEERLEEQELDDVEIAELANSELKARENEIAKLKKELAKAKLYSQAPEENEEVPMTKEEALGIIGNPKTCAYDYAKAFVADYDRCVEDGTEDLFGEYGKQTRDFFEECLELCEDDKSKFINVYQSKIGADDVVVRKK